MPTTTSPSIDPRRKRAAAGAAERQRPRALLLALAASLAGCSSTIPPTDDGAVPVDQARADFASLPDGGGTADATSPDSGLPMPTWSNFAQSFFQTYCIRCHNA